MANIKFADMAPLTRRGWVNWANLHDWGGNKPAFYDDATGELVTYGAEHHEDGGWRTVEARHKTTHDVRGWAGY